MDEAEMELPRIQERDRQSDPRQFFEFIGQGGCVESKPEEETIPFDSTFERLACTQDPPERWDCFCFCQMEIENCTAVKVRSSACPEGNRTIKLCGVFGETFRRKLEALPQKRRRREQGSPRKVRRHAQEASFPGRRLKRMSMSDTGCHQMVETTISICLPCKVFSGKLRNLSLHLPHQHQSLLRQSE